MIIWLSHLNLNEQDFSIYAQNYFLKQGTYKSPGSAHGQANPGEIYKGIQMKYNGKNM